MLWLLGHLHCWEQWELKTRLTEDKCVTKNSDLNNNIAEQHSLTNHKIDWDSTKFIAHCTNQYQWCTQESLFSIKLRRNSAEPLPTMCTTSSIQTTYWGNQQNSQTMKRTSGLHWIAVLRAWTYGCLDRPIRIIMMNLIQSTCTYMYCTCQVL